MKAGLPEDDLGRLFVIPAFIIRPPVVWAQPAADIAAASADTVDVAVVLVVDVDEPAVGGELVVVDDTPRLGGAAGAHAALRAGTALGVIYPGAAVESEGAQDVGHTTTVDDDSPSEQPQLAR